MGGDVGDAGDKGDGGAIDAWLGVKGVVYIE
jgi:hypothetical protein